MNIRYFDTPDSISYYGREIINKFIITAKTLASALNHFGLSKEEIELIVGRGKYNNINEARSDYIIYGPEKSLAASHDESGLFGAFPIIHFPELKLCQYAPKLLGDAGCKFVYEINGKRHAVSLSELKFDFVPLESKQDRGKIILRNDVHDLKSGTVLLNGRKWAGDKFDITDCEGRPLLEGAITSMLWGHVGSFGFKKFGRQTREFNTLAVDGVDDDFNAEGHLIRWLNFVNKNNGINLMPQFNVYVAEARHKLIEKPHLLAPMSFAIELGRIAGSFGLSKLSTKVILNKTLRNISNRGYIHDAGVAFKEVADFFNLELPGIDVFPGYRELLQRTCYNIKLDTVRSYLIWKASDIDPFNKGWIINKKGICSSNCENLSALESVIPDPEIMDKGRKLAEKDFRDFMIRKACNKAYENLYYLFDFINILRIRHIEAEGNKNVLREALLEIQTLIFEFEKGFSINDKKMDMDKITSGRDLLNWYFNSQRGKGIFNGAVAYLFPNRILQRWDNTYSPMLDNLIGIINASDGTPKGVLSLYHDCEIFSPHGFAANVDFARARAIVR